MSSKDFFAWRLEGDSLSEVPERVVEEGPLSLRVNGKPFTVTLRTPGNDRELVLGLMFSEGLVDAPEDLLAIYEESGEEVPGKSSGTDSAPPASTRWSASVKRRPALESKLSNRSLASTSSCGFCGKTEWAEGMDPALRQAQGPDSCVTLKIGSAFLQACFRAMQERQDLFGKTGGSHAAAVFSAEGSLLAFGEDAGRHNAVDKAVGFLWEKGRLAEGTVLCVSGRVSYEIASKATRAGFRVLAAVSAPSSMAVEHCRENGITLIGFCRGPRATVYAHPERVDAWKTTMDVEKA
jgi:FdhD protein